MSREWPRGRSVVLVLVLTGGCYRMHGLDGDGFDEPSVVDEDDALVPARVRGTVHYVGDWSIPMGGEPVNSVAFAGFASIASEEAPSTCETMREGECTFTRCVDRPPSDLTSSLRVEDARITIRGETFAMIEDAFSSRYAYPLPLVPPGDSARVEIEGSSEVPSFAVDVVVGAVVLLDIPSVGETTEIPRGRALTLRWTPTQLGEEVEVSFAAGTMDYAEVLARCTFDGARGGAEVPALGIDFIRSAALVDAALRVSSHVRDERRIGALELQVIGTVESLTSGSPAPPQIRF